MSGASGRAGERLRLHRPALILVMGVAGSGKTVLARSLLERLWAVYLDNNFISDAFFPDTREDPSYLQMRPRLYQALYRLTEENLRLGSSVLLDAPHVKQMQRGEWRDAMARLVERTSAALVILRCLCSEETLLRRLAERGERRDSWKLGHWGEYLQQQPIRVEIPFEHIDLDTEREQRENVREALRHIRQRVGGFDPTG